MGGEGRVTKRKTPVRHNVSGYTRRDGSKVQSHSRGKGVRVTKRTSKTVTSRPVKTREDGVVVLTDPKPFTVNLTYSDKPGDGETVLTIVGEEGTPLSEAYELALDEAHEEKIDPRGPISVEVVDPDLGAALEFIGSGAKKLGGLSLKAIKAVGKAGVKVGKKSAALGAKYAIKAGHVAKQVAIATGKAGVAGLKEASKMALYEIERSKVQRMLKQAYSRDKVVRGAARAALKRAYPSVYDICDFSRDRRRVVRRVGRRDYPRLGIIRPKRVTLKTRSKKI